MRVNVSNEEREKQWPCSSKTRKGDCSFHVVVETDSFCCCCGCCGHFVGVQTCVSSEFSLKLSWTVHVHTQVKTADHMDVDVDVHGRQHASTSMWSTRLRLSLRRKNTPFAFSMAHSVNTTEHVAVHKGKFHKRWTAHESTWGSFPKNTCEWASLRALADCTKGVQMNCKSKKHQSRRALRCTSMTK